MAAPLEYVSPSAIRNLFNEGRYHERLLAGEFSQEITVVGKAPSRLPDGYESQMITYRDAEGMTIAIVHQYGSPDGVPAPGSKPDPKFLFDNGIRYKLSRIAR